ncbi:MAG: nucleotidyltransferase family protein [Gemmatimonadetes bacterium]|nr:nucleotidyltransferase family protein [Gemmatimonadota bacterium]
MSDVAAIVLAAGASVRMGRNKLLLDLGGESVVRRAVRKAGEAGMSPVVVVTGHERGAVEAELHGIGCRAVYNAEHATGQHTSVGAGIAAVDGAEGCAAAVVVLADMPFVTAAMLRAVATRYRETGAPLVLSRYGGETIAPPMLYDRSLFGELLRMDRRCGREVARRHRAEAVVLDWPAEALRDLDSPEDYERARLEVEDGVAGAARARGAMDGAARVSALAGAAEESATRG